MSVNDNYPAIPLEGLELSTQLLIRGAWGRGLRVEVLDRRTNYIRISNDEISQSVVQATRTNLDPYLGVHLMTHKPLTNLTLRHAGLPVPTGIVPESLEEAAAWANQNGTNSIVIKPASTNFGQGISILESGFTIQALEDAWNLAKAHDHQVMVEDFISGEEVRVLVIGGEVRAALKREPANVIGDGQSSIADLVQIKNDDPLRGRHYQKPLEKIPLDEVVRSFLKKSGRTLNSIPLKGERVFLRKNSNISTGGDSIDITDELPAWAKFICEKAAQVLQLNITGVDLIWEQGLPSGQQKASARIIEMNFNPALHIHNYPYRGQNRMVEQHLLDALGF
jgi:glutamate--cysteine ligase